MNLSPNNTRAVEPLTFAVTRPLTQGDLQVNEAPPRPGADPLKRITERHHALARLLAIGTPPGKAALITGYVASTVSILQNDPSFQELMEFYRGEVDAEYLTMHAQLAGLGADAIAELRRRVEENPTEIGMSALMDIVKLTADRTGNGPSSSVKQDVTVTVDLAAKMKKAREDAAEARKMIDVTPQAAE